MRYAARRNRTVLRIDSENPDAEPQLVALADPSDPHRGISGLDLRPIPEQPKQLSRGYHQLAAYNRDSALPSEVFETNCRESAALLERQADQAGLPREVLAPIIEHVVPAYVRADALANYYQKRHVASVKNLFYLSAFAVTVAVAQVLFLPAYHLVILLEILAMAGVVGLWAFSRRQAWHEKWLHDRYLAEQLRTLIFTLMLDDRQRAAPYQSVDVLPFYSRPQHWLAATVSRIADTVRKAGTSYSEHVPVRTFLAAAWLEDQLGFHRRSAAKKMHQAHRLHWLGQFLFAATLLMAILHMAGVGHPHGEEHPAPYLRLDLWITFFAIVLPVWGAAVHAVTTQLEFERIGLRSGRMAQVLERLAERTKRAQSIEELRAVIAEGERIISIENHEWWVLLSFRPPVLPA